MNVLYKSNSVCINCAFFFSKLNLKFIKNVNKKIVEMINIIYIAYFVFYCLSYYKRSDSMAKRNRNKLLVPESRQELDQLKAKLIGTNKPEDAALEVAKELGIPLKDGYNGQLTSAEAGKVGGKIGGSMVKELVKMAQESIKKNQ